MATSVASSIQVPCASEEVVMRRPYADAELVPWLVCYKSRACARARAICTRGELAIASNHEQGESFSSFGKA